jgi:tetratricopeptide (TPR) repeat protein
MMKMPLYMVLVLAASLAGGGDVVAQSAETPDVSGLQASRPGMDKLQSLEQDIAREPQNLDHYFAYARMATELREYDKAVGMYERMLHAVPGLPRVKLELAVLYLREEQYKRAETLVRELLEEDGLPPQVEDTLATLEKRIEQATKRHILTGSVSTGVFYDTNANAAPDSGIVRIRFAGQELPFELNDNSDAQADAQLFGALTVNHLYRLEDALLDDTRMRWRSEGTVYRNEYDHLDTLNIKLYSVSTGPEITALDGQLRSWLSAGYNHVILNNRSFQRQYSLGLNTRYAFTRQTQLAVLLDQEWRDYIDSDVSQRLDQRDGDRQQVRLRLTHQITPKQRVAATLRWAREDTEQAFFDSQLYDASLDYTHTFDSGWFARGEGGYRTTHYDAPDPSISLTTREEDEWRSGVSIGKQFGDGLSLTMGYQYRDVEATLTNFTYDNHRISTILGWRF